MARENGYQADLIKRLKKVFPGVVILKNDSSYLQGVCDLLLLFEDRWAMLEVKRSADEPYQPNQEYWIERFNKMSFATTIYPENETEVIHALQLAFGTRGSTLLPQRK